MTRTIVSVVFVLAYLALAVWVFIHTFGWITFVVLMILSTLNLVWWCGGFGREKTDIELILEAEKQREKDHA